MDEIKAFAKTRPTVVALTDDDRDRLWSQVISAGPARDVTDVRSGVVLVEPLQISLHRHSHHERPGRVLVAVAAATVALLGIGGVLATANGASRQPAAAPPSTQPAVQQVPATPIMLLPPVMPEGLSISYAGESMVRNEPSGLERRVYGSADDPGDPTHMIAIEFSTGTTSIACQNMPAVTPEGPAADFDGEAWVDGATPFDDALLFDVAGTTGYTCLTYGPLAAGWITDGVTIELSAGTAVTRDQLVEFAQSLRIVPLASTDGIAAPVDLVADPVPAGWIALVTEDVPYAQRITETAWVAAEGGVGGAGRELSIHTWTGVDEQGLYSKMPPIQATRVTVRGHVGYQYVSTQRSASGPVEIMIWWTERPGMVVYVRATDLYEPDELRALIESMRPVDAAQYAAFNSDPANR